MRTHCWGPPKRFTAQSRRKQAYSTNFGDGTISLIDGITNSITATLDVLKHPEAVAVSPDCERVYVGDYWSRAVAVISVPMLRDLLGNT